MAHLSFCSKKGFTLIELMITVAIVVLVTVIGGITIESRIHSANLESAAQQLVSDIGSARSAAMFKGAHTRIIFCIDRNCTPASSAPQVMASITSGASNIIGQGTTPALYYGILRSTYSGVTSAVPAAQDGYGNWDFDRRPQQIAKGLAFHAIYVSGFYAQADWSTTSDPAALTSLYFATPYGDSTPPIAANSTAFGGDTVVMQVQFDNCNPAVDADCAGYLITLGAGGDVQMVKCGTGTRSSTASNICFN